MIIHSSFLFNRKWLLKFHYSRIFDYDIFCGTISFTSLSRLYPTHNILEHVCERGGAGGEGRERRSENEQLAIIPHNRALTIPSSTLPKTTCRPSSQDVLTVVMKNCEPLVSFPALAMLNQPGPSCFSLKFSSLNLFP